MKRRVFLGTVFTGPVVAALARTLPKVERAAPAQDFGGGAYALDSEATIQVGAAPAEQTAEGWDLGDYSGRSHPDKGVVSVQIGGTTYSLLAYD